MLERGGRRGACFPAVDLAEEVLLSSAKQLVGELPSLSLSVLGLLFDPSASAVYSTSIHSGVRFCHVSSWGSW